MLAEYGAAIKPKVRPLPDVQRIELFALIGRHRDLVALIVMGRNHVASVRTDKVRDNLRPTITFFTGQLADLDGRIRNSPAWFAAEERLRNSPGIGPIVARTLIGEFPELGRLSGKEISAGRCGLLGPGDSGTLRGRRTIWGERATVRAVLNLCALAGLRQNLRVAAHYQRLVARGEPKKVALVACIRKRLPPPLRRTG